METLPNSMSDCENASEVSVLGLKTDRSLQAFENPSNFLNDGACFVNAKGVLCQGFSIRDYVGKVRSLNIRKCWPFSESLLERCLREGGDCVLPPLKSPHHRWWACEHCGWEVEHKPFGNSSHRMEDHLGQPESYIRKIDRFGNRKINISLGPISDGDFNNSEDLEEQILKLSSVQISGRDDNTAEEKGCIRRTQTKGGKSNVYCCRQSSLGPPVFKTASSKIGTLDRISHRAGKGKLAQAHKIEQPDNVPAIQNQNGKPGIVFRKDSVSQSPGRSTTFDLNEREYRTYKDVGVRAETEKATEIAHEQVPAGRVPDQQMERSNIENLNSQSGKSELVRNDICNIANDEVSAVKVCPVCKVFTSTTITAVNAHIDDCLDQASKAEKKQGKMQKHKSRRQKKRSIVDICAVAPPADSHLDHPEKLGMNESEGSAAPSCKLNETIPLRQTSLENAVRDDLPTFNCKRKRANQGNSPIKHGKSGNGKAESLKIKRKRQHVGTLSSILDGVKELKMPLLTTKSTKANHGVERHLKPLSIKEDSRDSNTEQPVSMEINTMEICNLPDNQHQQSDNLMDHAQSASMLPKENRDKEDITSNYNAQREESDILFGDENTEGPPSIVRIANATTDVSHSYVTSDTVAVSNDISHSNNENSKLLHENECSHDKVYSADDSILQARETFKSEDPNLLDLSGKNPVYGKVTSLNPEKAGEVEQSNGTYGKSECTAMNCINEDHPLTEENISDQHAEPVNSGYRFVAQTEGKNTAQDNAKHNLGDTSNNSFKKCFDREKENPEAVESLQNERNMWETRKSTERPHLRNARLDLNKKVCVIPRDSKGRFLSSDIINGCKDGDRRFHQWKQTPSRISSQPPKSSLNTSENAMEFVNFGLTGNRTVHGYIGLPLDSQGEHINYNPNIRPGFSEVCRIPNYTVANQPSVSQGTKTPREFNFVESITKCCDVTSLIQPLERCRSKCLSQQNYCNQCQQADHQLKDSISRSNQSNPDKTVSENFSLLDQIQSDKMHCGSSCVRISTSSTGMPDIAMPSMQASLQSKYNADPSQKDVLEKTCNAVDITKWKQSTSQPIMRLMGQSFTIGGENEGRNSLNHPQQCNIQDTISTTGAAKCMSSTMQRTAAYIDQCIVCSKGQFDSQCPRGNALCECCRDKESISKSVRNKFKEAYRQELNHTESIPSHEDSILSNNSPKLVEKRPTTDYVRGHSLKDQTYSGQEWISSSSLSAPIGNMSNSPVRHFCGNTCLNEEHKMKCKDPHVSKEGSPLQKQTYSQLLNSYLEKSAFQKQMCNGWTYTSNPCFSPVHSSPNQPLACPTYSLGSSSGPLHFFTYSIAPSTSFLTEKQSHWQNPSIADSPTLAMPGNFTHSVNLAKTKNEKLIPKLPKYMTKNNCETRRENMRVTNASDVDTKCRDDSRTRKYDKETEGLLGQRFSGKHEDCVAEPMRKSDQFSTTHNPKKRKEVIHQEIGSTNIAVKHLKKSERTENNKLGVRHVEICKTNNSWGEFSRDAGISSHKKVENDSISNAPPQSGLSQKCLERKSGLYIEPMNKRLETEIMTSTIGLHCSNAGCFPKLAEPVKLSQGAKQLLKPPCHKEHR
ncbi:uncharacterized protein LOC131066527 [Cryptomeria japonica]|uniref:uncharacterized protein LOC131066527 n=1 Tax=Cryptomeria japonica TaxID=3369 RepID=UPI0027DA2DE3|nr:uncharacterized protein LOC131066527 [Cryptomeria japonica]